MLREPSSVRTTQSILGSDPGALGRFSFIEEFENVTASEARRAVRSHAMRAVRRQQRQGSTNVIRLKWPGEHSSSKKLQSSQPQEQIFEVRGRYNSLQPEERIERGSQEGDDIGATPSLEDSEPSRSLCKFDLHQLDPPEQITPPSGRTESPGSQSKKGSLQSNTLGAVIEAVRTGAGVSTLLGSGRIDPFQTYSIRTDRRVQELVDHYVTIMPATFYGVRCRRPIHVDLYRMAILHEPSIYAIAAYASKSLDFLHCSQPTKSTLDHTLNAIQSINEGLVTTSPRIYERDDGVVLSIALLAFAELRFGQIDIARQHWIGLREVIRFKGGFDTVRCDQSLKAVLAWNSTVFGASRYDQSLNSLTLPSLVAPETPEDLRLACQVFISFFHQLNFNAHSHSVYSDSDDPSHTAYPYKSSSRSYKQPLFAAEMPLHRLLRTKFDSSLGFSNQRAFDACQLPCLFYINAVTLEYANAPYLIDDFLSKLVNVVYEDNLHVCVSPEHLLVRLLVGIDGTEAVRDARLCEVTKLTYLAKRLGPDSLERVRCALWRNLVLSDGPCRRERLFTWDPASLEAEILED